MEAGIAKMRIWTNNNHSEACFSGDFTYTKLNYTHENPVRAGIVKQAEDYVYSSASNYAGLEGILEVELLDVFPGFKPGRT